MARLNSRGETIVEVLISIVVVGATLTGSYYTANRSSQQTRAAVERTEALKATESKVEALRNLAKMPEFSLEEDQTYCVSPEESTISSTCLVEPRYNVLTVRKGSTFEITAKWDSVLGKEETLTIYYRP